MESKKHTSELKKSKIHSAQEIMKTRLMYAIACVLGKRGRVKTKSGTMYEGHLYTMTSDGCVFRECRTNQGLEPSLNLSRDDFISLEFDNIQPVQHRKFKTDAEISKRKTQQDRELQKWEPEEDGHGVGLEDTQSGNWDQFKINEQKFGVRTTYDEHLYTTKVPHTSELTEAEVRRAEKLTKELEFGKDDYNEEEDEEAKYGAVLGTGRYKDLKSRKNKKYKKKREDATPKETKNSESSPFKESNRKSPTSKDSLNKLKPSTSATDKEQLNSTKPLTPSKNRRTESFSTSSTNSSGKNILFKLFEKPAESVKLSDIGFVQPKESDSATSPVFKQSDEYRRSDSYPQLQEDRKDEMLTCNSLEARMRCMSYVRYIQSNDMSSPTISYNPLAQEFTVTLSQPSGVDTIFPFFSREPPKHLIEYYIDCWKKIQQEVKNSWPSTR